MDKSPANVSYRLLELLCRQQARLSATPATRQRLERMARDYWQEHQWPEPDEQGYRFPESFTVIGDDLRQGSTALRFDDR